MSSSFFPALLNPLFSNSSLNRNIGLPRVVCPWFIRIKTKDPFNFHANLNPRSVMRMNSSLSFTDFCNQKQQFPKFPDFKFFVAET